MNITWVRAAWEQYQEWIDENKKILKRIDQLIEDILRNGNLTGAGNPEALKGDLSGFYSRHIDKYNRLIYRVTGDTLEIISCKGHYDK